MLLGSAFAVPCEMCEAWAILWAVQGGVDVVSRGFVSTCLGIFLLRQVATQDPGQFRPSCLISAVAK